MENVSLDTEALRQKSVKLKNDLLLVFQKRQFVFIYQTQVSI
jgi:hypothetical protein